MDMCDFNALGSQCDWKKRMREDEEVAKFCRGLSFRPPFNPRDALRGGRNECFTALVEFPSVDSNVTIRALDVVSLYPAMVRLRSGSNYKFMFYKFYPVGLPEVHVGSTNCSLNHFTSDGNSDGTIGLLHCEILPPQNLHIPLLPLRIGDTAETERLLFCLCYQCSIDSLSVGADNVPPCCHSEKQRAFQGVYCSPEVLKAVQLGYSVLQIYEEYVFQAGSADVFKSYISTIFQVKAQASGWPVPDEAGRAAFMSEYTKRMGTTLDANKMVRNNGLRQISKLLLNSLYGKFGQKSRRRMIRYITTFAELQWYYTNPMYTLVSMTDVEGGEKMAIELESNDDIGEHAKHCSLTVAALITCYARLELYRIFEAIGFDRIHYADTDSAIFSWPRDVPLPPALSIGGFLGDLEDVEGRDMRITHYVCCGQKTYSYQCVNDVTGESREVVKAKGATVQMRKDGGLNYDTLRKLLVEKTSTLLSGRDCFRRDVIESTVRVVPRTLRIRSTLGKRQFFPDKGFTSLPFGFVE